MKTDTFVYTFVSILEKGYRQLTSDTYRVGVTGHFASGKTAFIRSISDVPVHNVELDVGHTRIIFDYGEVQVHENKLLHLYGNPSAYPSHGVLRISQPDLKLSGIVVMVNTTKPEQFREAASSVATLTAFRPISFIVAANPYEYNEAARNVNEMTKPTNGLELEAVRTSLRVPNEVPVVPCVATDRESVRSVLVTLLEVISGLSR